MRCAKSFEFRNYVEKIIKEKNISNIVVLFDNNLAITKIIREIDKNGNININIYDKTGKIELFKTNKVELINNIIDTYWHDRNIDDIEERKNFIKDEEYNEDDLEDIKALKDLKECENEAFAKWVETLTKAADKNKLNMPVKNYEVDLNNTNNIKFIKDLKECEILNKNNGLIIINETHERYPEIFNKLVEWIYKDNKQIIILEKETNNISMFNLLNWTHEMEKICYASITSKNKKAINLNLIAVNLK